MSSFRHLIRRGGSEELQRQGSPRAPYLAYIAAIVIAGVAFQFFLWTRQSLLGDQITLLGLGVEYTESGALAPVAKGMSGGGSIPGGFLQLLVGVPLKIWPDYRAPALAVVLSQLLAVALLAVTIGRAMGLRFLAFFLAVYWLSPWRVYHSGFLWEPNFVFLPAALHLYSSYQLRSAERFLPSALLTATIILTMQVHASFLILAIASVILVWRKLVRLDWRGAIAGCVIGSLTLIPTAIAFFRGELPRIVPHATEDVPAVIMPFANVLKGFLYWFRLGSPDVGRRLRGTAYLDGSIDAAPFVSVPGAVVVVIAIAATLAIAVSVLASWKYLRSPDLLRPSNPTGPAQASCVYLVSGLRAVLSPGGPHSRCHRSGEHSGLARRHRVAGCLHTRRALPSILFRYEEGLDTVDRCRVHRLAGVRRLAGRIREPDVPAASHKLGEGAPGARERLPDHAGAF